MENDEKSCDRIWCFVSERVKVPEINWKRHGEFYEYESGFFWNIRGSMDPVRCEEERLKDFQEFHLRLPVKLSRNRPKGV